VVVFAKSGVGKSSLLYAGLFPKLKKNNYYPIKIRFQNLQKTDSAAQATTQANPIVFSIFTGL